MKKRSITMSVIAVLMIAALLFGCGKSKNELPISRNEAKEIAIQQLGVSQDVTSYAVVTTAGSAKDPYYIVEVLLQGVVYSYRIDPTTGDIRKMTINDQNVDLNDLPVNPSDPASKYIGLESAKAVAFEDAGVKENAVKKLDFEMDFAYGKYLYDIEFTVNGHEYEYEIVAENGEIFKKDVDHVTVIVPTVDEGEFIGVEKAKEIALTHADVLPNDAVFEIVEWDMKKGSAVYNVEFTTKNGEYEYDIHAVTGEIIKHDSEGEFLSTGESTNHITPEQAKKIAISHAGVNESEVRFEGIELDFERGTEVFEVEFSVGKLEYEYEINAKTGEVIRAQQDYDD
ncbi:MAG: hypothetical protein E7616_08600 [Ruminococcaceae bacterium]|nr:hypothetical protein [Oscillospiraceae bacterium]